MSPTLTALDHLVLTVRDIARTVAFYETVLSMSAQVFHPADGSARTALIFGAQKINLHPLGGAYDPKAASPTPGSADLCFLSAAPLADWQAHLSRCGVTIEAGPVRRAGATGPILSLYIRDPDANLIEIATPAN